MYRPLRLNLNEKKSTGSGKPKLIKRKKQGSDSSSADIYKVKIDHTSIKCKNRRKKDSKTSPPSPLTKTFTKTVDTSDTEDVYGYTLSDDKTHSANAKFTKDSKSKTRKCNNSNKKENISQSDVNKKENVSQSHVKKKENISQSQVNEIRKQQTLIQNPSKPRIKKMRKSDTRDKQNKGITKCPMAYKKGKTQCPCVTTDLLKLICESANEDGLEAAEIESRRIRTLSVRLSGLADKNEIGTSMADKNDYKALAYDDENETLKNDDNVFECYDKRHIDQTLNGHKKVLQDVPSVSESTLLGLKSDDMKFNSLASNINLNRQYGDTENQIQKYVTETNFVLFGSNDLSLDKCQPTWTQKKNIGDKESEIGPSLNTKSNHGDTNIHKTRNSITNSISSDLEITLKSGHIKKAEQNDDIKLIQNVTNANNVVSNNDIKLIQDKKNVIPNNDLQLISDKRKIKNAVPSNDFKIIQDLHRYHALWLKHCHQNKHMSNYSNSKRGKLIIPKLEDEKKAFHKQRNNNNALTKQTISYIKGLRTRTASFLNNQDDKMADQDKSKVDGQKKSTDPLMINKDRMLDQEKLNYQFDSQDRLNYQNKLTYQGKRLVQSAGANKENNRSSTSSGKCNSSSAPSSRNNSALLLGMRRKSQKKIYSDFYVEHDFTGTTQRYISRDMQVDLTKMFLQ